MKKGFLIVVAILNFTTVFSQINIEDSTVQVISYWNKLDKQTYKISEEAYKVTDAKDTVKREFSTYFVDVEVVDSTKDSYTVKWQYRDLNIVSSTNPFAEKLFSISSSTPIIFTVSEMGAFKEVVNWKELRDIIKKGIKMLSTDYKDTVPNFDKLIEQIGAMYSTKEAIESTCIQDIQQFYTFHGGKYKLGEEIIDSLKVSNGLGGSPFDAELSVMLDEINSEDDNFILRTTQTVDANQLTDAVYDYVKKVSETMKIPFEIKRENFPLGMNEISTASRIHGGSGWVIYTVQTKIVSMENVTSFNERIIEIE